MAQDAFVYLSVKQSYDVRGCNKGLGNNIDREFIYKSTSDAEFRIPICSPHTLNPFLANDHCDQRANDAFIYLKEKTIREKIKKQGMVHKLMLNFLFINIRIFVTAQY